MKKIVFILLVAVNLFAQMYTVSNNESNIKFSATKFMFVGVDGSFSQFEGNIKINNKKLISLTGTVDTNSISTADKKRDSNLKSKGYFNVVKYPKMKISTVSIDSTTVVAKVSIKDIEKEIEFNIDKFSVIDNKVELSLSSTIDRQQFMLNGFMSGVINDKVNVSVMLVAK